MFYTPPDYTLVGDDVPRLLRGPTLNASALTLPQGYSPAPRKRKPSAERILCARGIPVYGDSIKNMGALAEGVSGEPPEDPVKNGACLRNVRPRRGR